MALAGMAAEEGGAVVAAAWSESATVAAAEIACQLAPYDLSGLVVFISPDYDVTTFASEIARRFGVTPVVGCTTAGEIGGRDDAPQKAGPPGRVALAAVISAVAAGGVARAPTQSCVLKRNEAGEGLGRGGGSDPFLGRASTWGSR